MNRSWITALTLATVAGSGGAFAGVVANNGEAPAAAAQSQPLVTPAALLRIEPQVGATGTFSYQVGAAGTTTLSVANGMLTVDKAVSGAGWFVANGSLPGTHIDVQFTDGTQLVTFGADLVGNNVIVSLSNAAAPGPVTAVSAEPVNTTLIQAAAPAESTTTSPPQPATPPATAAPAVSQPPTTSATTAPSGSGESDNEGTDDHETESNDD